SGGGGYTRGPGGKAAGNGGDPVALETTDEGRAALGDRPGPGVMRIEGRLASPENDAYVISVSEITAIGAGSSHWTGEQVTVQQGFVSRVEERSLSRSRTILAIGAAVAAVTVFIITRTLVGGGSEAKTPDGAPGQGS